MDDFVKGITKKIVTIEIEDIGLRYMKVCKVCEKEFPLGDFTAHEKTHSRHLPVNQEEGVVVAVGEDDYLCSTCGETFQKESPFRIHQIQKHSSSLVVILTKTPLLQEACRRRLALDCNENETKTKLTLLKSKRFKCRYCEKSFVLSSQCRSHENAHAENVVVKADGEDPISTIQSKSQTTVVNSLELESVETEVTVLPSDIENQVEITRNEIQEITSASSVSSVGKEQGREIQENLGKMESQSAISGTSIEEIMEMPKLISPIKLEPIEFNQLSELINFQASHESMSSFATSLAALSAVPIESEPRIYETSEMSMSVKQEFHTNKADFSNVITNGDISSEECKEKSHNCLTCSELFPESQLFAHIKTHLIKGQKVCSLCPYKAIASGDLRDHMNKHYNIKPYKCPICPNSYGWQSGWKKHMGTHGRNQKLFKCTHCKLHFSTQRERRRHELIHQNINGPSPIKKQKKVTKSRKKQNVDCNLQSEISGNGEGKYTPQMEYDYTPQHQHHEQQQHNYVAPYSQPQDFMHNSQPYYNEALYNNQNYAQDTSHEQIGNSWDAVQTPTPDYTNYSLPYTDQGNAEVQNQIQNWTEFHHGDQNTNSNDTDVELEKIDEAQKHFREPDDLRESETCKTCGEIISMTELRAHIQTHILPGQKACTICKYKCSTRVYLEEHYNIHYGIKPYTCSICKRKFAMRSYLRSHTQQVHDSESTRRYQCRYCNKRFVRPCHKRTHEKIHEGQSEHLQTTFSSVNHDSDSSSNSNHSHRPVPNTSDRGSTTSSPSIFSIYASSPAKSPHSASMTPCTTPIPDSQWSNGQVTPIQPQQPQVPWPYWSGNQYSAGEFQQTGYEQSSWVHGNYYNSPLVKSDVNWTEPLSESSPWLQNQGHSHAYSHVKNEPVWGDSSSSGFHSTSTSTSTSSLPPSAAVSDLWAELQYEEMKWLPETSTVYTADGIPMITEFAPFEGSFSYTDMLNSAAADLPVFGSAAVTEQSDDQVQNEPMKSIGSVPLVNSEEEMLKKEEKITSSGWKGQVPSPKKNHKGRGKGKLTAEAKHKRMLSFVKTGAETVDNDGDVGQESLPPSTPKALESSGDDEPEDPDSLMKCQTCQVEIIRRDLLRHIRDHLLPGQRTCDLCQRTYCNPLTLREHIHVHYNLKPHKCSFCEARFSTRYSLKTHEAFTHEEGKASILECPDCGKLFAMRNEFHKHLKTHEDKNGMTRHVTQKERRSTVEIELETKEKEAQIKDAKSKTWEVRLFDIGRTMKKKCPLCDEEIVLADFFEHKYSHRDPCHICQKPILCTEILYHGPTHIGSEIQCEICGWKAQQRSQLWEHMNGHLKVKPIRCLYCGVGFASRNSLRSHYLGMHTNFRPHSCRYCEKTFVQGTSMKQHELTHFGTQCPICPQSFTFRKDLRLHLREAHKFDF